MKILNNFFLLCCCLFLSSCATRVAVESKPTGAKAILEKNGIIVTTNATTDIDSKFFKGEKTAQENITFTKDDYRTQHKDVELIKGEDNLVSAKLDKIDTSLKVTSTPIPMQLEFVGKNGKEIVEHSAGRGEESDSSSRYILPEEWPKQFSTPVQLRATQVEAEELMENVKLVMPDDTGYLPTEEDHQQLVDGGMELSLTKGRANEIALVLEPIITTLKVESDPPGALVEDVRAEGFGKLGETPLSKEFRWDELNAEKSVCLKLKISKPGYKEARLEEVCILAGEERSFKKKLAPKTIHFNSKPDGVVVSVERIRETPLPNGGSTSMPVGKTIGKTPFNRLFTAKVGDTMPNQRLQEGEKLIFTKKDYCDAQILFSEDKDKYDITMRPKADGCEEQE
ncbi:MAG: hypothetical protein SD837_10365 [Candidatus Electrothrix scaldis]|nr:MAG: hypothetical protein SD837_10365 [Candidatus Electrothrix sp. GW3-3]